MREVKAFQAFILRLIEKHNATAFVEHHFEIGERDTALRIQNPIGGISPLEIINVAKNIIYVQQPSLLDGKSDPGITFFTSPLGSWWPIGIQQLIGPYRVYVKIDEYHTKMTRYNKYWQHDLASFCNGFWVSALREQGFGKVAIGIMKSEKYILLQEDPELFVEYDEEKNQMDHYKDGVLFRDEMNKYHIWYRIGPFKRYSGTGELYYENVGGHKYFWAVDEIDATRMLESTIPHRDRDKLHIYKIEIIKERSHE